jgi:hypothetical protein
VDEPRRGDQEEGVLHIRKQELQRLSESGDPSGRSDYSGDDVEDGGVSVGNTCSVVANSKAVTNDSANDAQYSQAGGESDSEKGTESTPSSAPSSRGSSGGHRYARRYGAM